MLFELAIGIPLVISIKKYTLYNMQSVTSNAVAEALGEWEVIKTDNSTYIIRGKETSEGTFLQGHFQGTPQSTLIFLPPVQLIFLLTMAIFILIS